MLLTTGIVYQSPVYPELYTEISIPLSWSLITISQVVYNGINSLFHTFMGSYEEEVSSYLRTEYETYMAKMKEFEMLLEEQAQALQSEEGAWEE